MYLAKSHWVSHQISKSTSSISQFVWRFYNSTNRLSGFLLKLNTKPVPASNKEAACGQPSFPSLRLHEQYSMEHTYIVIFMKPSKRQARSRWVAAGIGWSRFRKLQPLLQLGTNEINSGSVRATVANEIYMKLRIRMASSHSGSFAKWWFLGRNKMKRMSARQEILFKEEESDTLYFNL